jgi:hypothetical protein
MMLNLVPPRRKVDILKSTRFSDFVWKIHHGADLWEFAAAGTHGAHGNVYFQIKISFKDKNVFLKTRRHARRPWKRVFKALRQMQEQPQGAHSPQKHSRIVTFVSWIHRRQLLHPYGPCLVQLTTTNYTHYMWPLSHGYTMALTF